MKVFTIRNIFMLLLSIICLHIIILDIDYVSVYSSGNKIIDSLTELYRSFCNINFKLIIIIFLLFKFFDKYLFCNSINKKYIIYSIILSIISIMGKCYISNSSTIMILFKSFIQIYKLLILFISYSVIYYAVICMISNFNKVKISNNYIVKKWERHPVIYTSIILFICWVPYLIIFYPGGATGDTADSIYQFFHSSNSWSVKSINLLSNSVFINKHHSVLFTVILGNFIKIGRYIIDNNFGLFLYNLFQFIILIVFFVYVFNYLKKNKFPSLFILLLIIYYCFNPVVIKYSITAVKDTLSAVFTCVYALLLLNIIKDNYYLKKRVNVVLLIIVMLLVILCRNNGIYTIMLSYPFLLLIKNNYRKKFRNILILTLLLFICYDRVLLPSLNVSNGSIREILSIPFMQVARTIKYHGDDFNDNDIKVINNVLDYDVISRNYNPNISDDIKNTYKKDSTKRDNYNFFKLWFKYFKRYPLLYVDSFINSSYGYYYPVNTDYTPTINIVGSLNMQEDVKFNYVRKFNNIKVIFNEWLCFIYKNPLGAIIYNVGVLDLFLLFSIIYIFNKKQYRYIIPLLPLLAVFLVCLASPVNGISRYVLPIYLSLPLIIYIDYLVHKNTL